MFDIGFSELVLIFIIGLVVLGPKRLPIAIRTVMGWVRTIRGLATTVQNELAQELKLQELQESIKKAESLNLSRLSPELEKTVEDLKQSAEKMKSELASAKGEIQSLSNEQVADIQQRIATESENLQNSSLNSPLAQAETVDNPEKTGEQAVLSPAEIAELAEADEEKLTVYYPPDDDLAHDVSTPISSSNKSNSNVS